MNFNEFDEFKNENGVQPSVTLTQAIFARVDLDLNPSAWRVFGELSLIHCIVGAFTLSLCPQFGIRLWGDGIGLMEHFMKMGSYGCMGACGALFVGLSILVAAFLLSPEEVRILRKNQILEFGALALLSLGVFVMLHAEIVAGFALAWLLGAWVGGSFGLRLACSLRKIALT